MNPSRIFILRPVATSLLMLAILLAGLLALEQAGSQPGFAVESLPSLTGDEALEPETAWFAVDLKPVRPVPPVQYGAPSVA